MPVVLTSTQILNLRRGALIESPQWDAPDLTSRQSAALLTVYMTPQPHSVCGLTATLNVSKLAISRALDPLGASKLLRRKTDEDDQRPYSVR